MAIDFDEILDKVGEFGLYQKLMYILICLPASFPCAWSAFNQVFVTATPDHWCSTNGSDMTYHDQILSVHQQKILTIPMEHRDMAWYYSQCLEYNLTFSDHIIKSVLNSSESVQDWMLNPSGEWNRSTSSCSNGWSHNSSTYESTVVTEFELYCDRSNWPVICTTVFYIGSFIGNILFGYIADRWGRRPSFFAILLLQVVSGTVSSFSPDVYTFTVLRFFVGLTFPALYQIPYIIGVEMMGPSGRIYAGMVVCALFGIAMCALGLIAYVFRQWKTLTLVCNAPFAILLTYWWLVNALVYNGLTMNISNLGVNDYFAFAINGAVEVPAYFLVWPLLDRFGRRWLLVSSMIVGGLSCLCAMFVSPSGVWVISGLGFAGKFGIAASFSVLYIFAGELYPTVVRAIGMGFSSMIAGSGLILAPYLVHLGNYLRILPLLIMGALTVLAGTAAMFLPETTGAHMPQTIQDAENYGKNFGFFYILPPKDAVSRHETKRLQDMALHSGEIPSDTFPMPDDETL